MFALHLNEELAATRRPFSELEKADCKGRLEFLAQEDPRTSCKRVLTFSRIFTPSGQLLLHTFTKEAYEKQGRETTWKQ